MRLQVTSCELGEICETKSTELPCGAHVRVKVMIRPSYDGALSCRTMSMVSVWHGLPVIFSEFLKKNTAVHIFLLHDSALT